MFRAGWIAEVESLLKKYPASIPAFNSIGYKQVVDFLQSKSKKTGIPEILLLAQHNQSVATP